MSLEIRMIQIETPEYEAEKKLRSRILREPLGLKFTPEDFATEKNDLHFGAYFENELVGCLILTPIPNTETKMRQVAIATDRQGMGIGRKLVQFAEDAARAQQVKRLRLKARETAIPFYLTLGYEIEGEPLTEVGLPHRWMTKNL